MHWLVWRGQHLHVVSREAGIGEARGNDPHGGPGAVGRGRVNSDELGEHFSGKDTVGRWWLGCCFRRTLRGKCGRGTADYKSGNGAPSAHDATDPIPPHGSTRSASLMEPQYHSTNFTTSRSST